MCPRKHMPVGPRVCRPAGLKNGPSSSPNGFRSSWPMRPCTCRVYVEGSEPLDELKRRAASDMYSTLLLPKGCRLRWCGRRRRKGRQELDARVRAGKGGGLWGGGARESQLLNRIWRRPPARVERRGRRGALLELSGNVALALEQPGEPPQQRMIATTASGRSNGSMPAAPFHVLRRSVVGLEGPHAQRRCRRRELDPSLAGRAMSEGKSHRSSVGRERCGNAAPVRPLVRSRCVVVDLGVP